MRIPNGVRLEIYDYLPAMMTWTTLIKLSNKERKLIEQSKHAFSIKLLKVNLSDFRELNTDPFRKIKMIKSALRFTNCLEMNICEADSLNLTIARELLDACDEQLRQRKIDIRIHLVDQQIFNQFLF